MSERILLDDEENDCLHGNGLGISICELCDHRRCSIPSGSIDEHHERRAYGFVAHFQGTGKSKKEAKIAGARRAFAALLDLDEEAFDTKFAGKRRL